MNKVILVGRLTDEPKTRATATTDVTNYSLAIDRRGEGTDYINIVAFGKAATFADKYFHKGMRVAVEGRIQTGSYTNKNGVKVNTFEVVAENQEFADGKRQSPIGDGFEYVPEGVDDGNPFV